MNNDSSFLVHLEFQRYEDADIDKRVLEYNVFADDYYWQQPIKPRIKHQYFHPRDFDRDI